MEREGRELFCVPLWWSKPGYWFADDGRFSFKRLDCTYLAELLAKSKVAPKSSHTSLILCPQNITHLTTENPLVFEYVMKMYQDLADKSIEI